MAGIAMKKKRLLLLLVAFFLILFVSAFFGSKGIFRLFRLKKELMRITEANVKIEEENQRLREEIRRLRYEKSYLEEIARKELGMVKAGEMIYEFDRPGPEKGSSK